MDDLRLSKIMKLLLIPVVVLPLLVWANQLNLARYSLTSAELFPVFGMVAFSIMWWHFLLGFVSNIRPSFKKTNLVYKTSVVLVLMLIILHPLVLGSINGLSSLRTAGFDWVVSGNELFVYYGIFALFIFLLYDVARLIRKRSFVKKYWQVIDAVDDVAFVAIFVHSTALGRIVTVGWFRYVWIFYGVSALIFIGYKHYRRFAQNEETKTV